MDMARDIVRPTELVVRRSVEREFDRFARSRDVSVVGRAREGDRRGLQRLCTRPEFGPLIPDTTFRFDDDLMPPGVASRDGTVSLHRDVLNNPAAAAVLLRYVLELCMLQRLLPGQHEPATQLVITAVAYHVAAAYYSMLIEIEKERASGAIPAWIADLADDGLGDPGRLLEQLRRNASGLFAPQGGDAAVVSHMPPGSTGEAAVRALLEETIVLAYPTESLLTQGGDNRLLIDPKTGLNKYGCSPKPRPWAVTFASCTGSSVSDMGYLAAERTRQELLLGAFRNGLGNASLDQAERTRREITHAFGLDTIPGTEIILASSATDAELVALYLTLGGHDDPVTNIIVAPNEVGSGTVPATSGRHFDNRTPMGSMVEPGTPVVGLGSDRVTLVEIPIRHENGDPVDAAELDRQVLAVVEGACSQGNRVLMHLLDSSKTGVGAPSIDTARYIKRQYGERINVLVDAAQMRLSRQALQDYVLDGFLVLVSGSKFFTGPPFSGALVLPPATARRADSLPEFPQGLADYATPSDLPHRWRALTATFPDRANVGLLLRWQAALWEIKAFYAVAPEEQFETVRQFLTVLIGAIDDAKHLELVTAPSLERLQRGTEAQWDQIQTIFSFFVKREDEASGDSVILTYEEAQRAYRWLNMDLSGFLPSSATDTERRVAGVRCHIGQPVRIFRQGDAWYAALRIAVGARLISGVEFDPMLGSSPGERLSTELDGALTALSKLSIIGRHWHALATAEIDGQSAESIDGLGF